MLGLLWLRGLLVHRRARLLGAIAGIAIAVSLVASIGTFLSGSTAAMTDRAIAGVPLDWQVQAQAGASPARVLAAVRAFPAVRSALPSRSSATSGYSRDSRRHARQRERRPRDRHTRRATATLPRPSSGSTSARSGVLIAQQMAANLGVGVGGTVVGPATRPRPRRAAGRRRDRLHRPPSSS